MAAFDPDQFVQSCLAALDETDAVGAIGELVSRAVSDPQAVARTFAVPLDPDDDGVLHRSPNLFVSQVVFPRGFRTGIHDHSVTAVIGVWAGHEDNHLYRPRSGGTARGVDAQGLRRVEVGDVLTLPVDQAHDVHAPDTTWSGALHVYLGDLPALERGYWTTVDSERTSYDGDEQERRWSTAAVETGLLRSS